jgi:hypothetical protein
VLCQHKFRFGVQGFAENAVVSLGETDTPVSSCFSPTPRLCRLWLIGELCPDTLFDTQTSLEGLLVMFTNADFASMRVSVYICY